MTSPLDINDFAYRTGTLTIAPGDTTAVFDGAGLSAVVKDGDYLFAGGSLAIVKTVNDDANVELFTAWAGSSVSVGPYLILKASLLRYHTALIGYDAGRLLALLDETNVWYVVEGDAPDPSLGEDGTKALKPNSTPWKVWFKVDGVWELQPGSPGGQGDPGATWIVQDSEPTTDYPAGSVWLDSDSADLDVYQLGGSPVGWEDTGVNLKGAAGPGVPAGGATGQVLAKVDGDDYSTGWVEPPSGGGDVAGDTHAAVSKATPVDADELPLVDSAASNVLKKLTWENLKAKLAAWLVSAGWIRERLTADRTYYFATAAGGGSDNNDGKTALTPFLTGQKAVNTVAAIDISIYNVAIQAADGTYTGAIRFPGAWVGTGTVTLQGNNTSPGNVIISTTGADAIAGNNGAVFSVKDMELRTTTSGYALRGQGGARISYQNIRFGACAQSHIRSEDGAVVTATGDYSIVGSANLYHWNSAGAGAQIVAALKTITLTGTPNFNTFALASSLSALRVNGNTFNGSATGARYSVSGNSVISVGGQTITYLPGDAAATTPTQNGGQYF